MLKATATLVSRAMILKCFYSISLCDNSSRQNKTKNPLDCDIPACKSKSDMLMSALRKHSSEPSKENSSGNMKGLPVPYAKEGCPVDKEELGHSTWNLLHTMAAVYPKEPEESERENMRQFLTLLSLLYPCVVCAADFQASLERNPPDVSSRSALSLWMCRLHNEVNEKLDKPLFSCEVESIERRWREGGEECED